MNDPRLAAPTTGQASRSSDETASSALDSNAPLLGVIGRFQLHCVLGSGSYGRVYRAYDTLLDREVALKVPRLGGDDASDRKRFLREAQAAAQLRHPNIIAVYECGQTGEDYYIASELVEGETLATRIEVKLPEFRQASAWVRDLALALAYAHSKGIIHRDIKPGNIMLGKDEQPQIMDFGLAKRLGDDASLTVEGSLLGTPAFMSPEQARGEHKEVGPPSDQYSLGVVFYELLTGKRPFDGPIHLVLAKVAQDEPPLPSQVNPNVSPELEAICCQAMAKQAQHRYPSIALFAADLDHWLKGEPIQARRDSRRKGVAQPPVGIDLGTTISAVACLDPSGRPSTVANAVGDLLTPSALLFEGPDVVMGKEAVRGAAINPAAYVDFFKRDMGRAAVRRKVNGHDVPPEVLSAFLLAHLKEGAEQKLGTIRQAVITVPAFFDEARRMMTQEAGRMAGLDVLDIINEPTAAAIAYGYSKGFLDPHPSGGKAPRQRVLVYDLGGGTFDITLLEIEGHEFRTLATDGDVYLGGGDFDQRLADYLAEQFLAQTGIDPRSEPRQAAQLRSDAQQAKHALSARTKTTVDCSYGGQRTSLEVTRQKFEQLTRGLLERTETTMTLLIKQAGLAWDGIDRVLLVGGSSRMPMVAQMLRRVTGKEPDRSQSPDEAVAHGAALYAGMLMQIRANATCRLVNVNAHSLGAVGLDPKSGRQVNAIVIPRNTPLPHRAARKFKTAHADQRSVKVFVVEGESERPEDCIALGECTIRDLPPDLRKGTPIQVEYGYESNGRIAVTACIPHTQQSAQVEIIRSAQHTPDDLAVWRRRLCGILASR